jgi:HNH endonuclease
VAIAEKEVKLLWGRAAGYCSNPECRTKLSSLEDENNPFLLGEMAHIVARNVGGPRAAAQPGADVYQNLILLCPTCHTKIDKAPGSFPIDLLSDWKAQHEAWVEQSLSGTNFETAIQLFKEIAGLLQENEYFFRKYGPMSEAATADPNAAEFALWLERRLDVIVPNNRKIVALIERNCKLLDEQFQAVSLAFRDHALAYEQHIYNRMERYPLFPKEFSEIVDRLAHER